MPLDRERQPGQRIGRARPNIDSSSVKTLHFDTEDAARTYLDRCRDAVPDTDWKPLSRPSTNQH